MSMYASDVRIASARAEAETLDLSFDNGVSISIPWALLPTLATATPWQRRQLELIADGDGLHWPDLDEDLSATGLFAGRYGSALPAAE